MNNKALLLLFCALHTLLTHSTNTQNILDRVDNALHTNKQTTTAHQFTNFTDCFQAANTAFCNSDFETAIGLYTRALNYNDTHPQVHLNLAVSLIKKELFTDAITYLHNAIERDPTYAKALYHLGNCYQHTNDTNAAQMYLNRAVSCDPHCYDAHMQLAHILKESEQFENAITHLRIAHQLRPDNTQTTFDLANALNSANHTQEALEIYLELEKQIPNSVSVLYNIAYTLKKLNRLRDAMPYYQKVLARNPNHTEAHFSRGLAYLLTGDFKRGWKDYEWRWQRDIQKGFKRNLSRPEWDGSDLNGKTIVLYCEQGLGDTFQFIRFARYAHEKGGRVIVLAQNPVIDILKLCPYIDQVLSLTSIIPPYDVHAGIMSIPHIINLEQDSIPIYDSYLYADPHLEHHWQKQLSQDTNFKVGICWQGNNKYSTAFLRAVVAAKSMHISTFTPLANIENISFYSLQKQTGEDQLNELPEGFNLITFDGDFDNSHGRFMDTAAVIKNLDLVISIDTSICHFAAALGAETWNMLPNPPDWRWMLDRNDTPWYPNMRLFRQPIPGDWQSVMHTIAHELKNKVTQWKYKKNNQPLSSTIKSIVHDSLNGNSIEYSTESLMEHIDISINREKLLKLTREFAWVKKREKQLMDEIDALVE